MIKAVLFDLGGVIIDIQPFAAQVLEVFQPEDTKEFWAYINVEAVPLCKGEVTLLQFWKTVAKTCGKDVPEYVLKDLWVIRGEPDINEGISEIVYSLKNRYKLAIISNTMKEHKFEKKGIFALFDVVILSCDVGLTKDGTDIFLMAAKKLQVNPEECLFIDDIPQFVEVAESVGMKGILFENAANLKCNLEKYGVIT